MVDHRPHPDGVEVRLSETLLYPEGGGQPDDHGTISGAPVRGLRRDAGAVWHLLDRLPEAGEVEVIVDWARRYDHMQQHTAQHLISAIAEDLLDAPTTAFHLRPDVCDIDVGRVLSEEEVHRLEVHVNAAIRDDRPVTVRTTTADKLDAVRTRGLPAGFRGAVRLIEIAGIDSNTCGGTHVATLRELQVISLLPPQKSKGGTKLRYLAGGRVLAQLSASHRREHAISTLLSCGPAEHAEAIQHLQQGARDTGRAHKQLMAELATLQGAAVARAQSPHLHREGADMDFLRAAASTATAEVPERVFLFTSDTMFMLAGPPESVSALGPQVAGLLGGRGGGARGRYQGRIGSLDRIGAVISLLTGGALGEE